MLRLASIVALLATACAITPTEQPRPGVAEVCEPSPAVNVDQLAAPYIRDGVEMTAIGSKVQTVKLVNGTGLADGVYLVGEVVAWGNVAVKVAPPPPTWACEVLIEVREGNVLVRCARVHTCNTGCEVSREDNPSGAVYRCRCAVQ